MFKTKCRKIVEFLKKMYNNLQQFGPPDQQQPDMSVVGTWTKIHPQFQGPDTVYVRDMIMDGENMLVITSNGQMDMGVFSSHYVKQSDEEYDTQGNVIGVSQQETEPAPEPEYSKFVPKTDIDYDLLVAGMGAAPDTDIKNYVPDDVKVDAPLKKIVNDKSSINIEVKNTEPIARVMSKVASQPKLTINLEWSDFPKSEIEMLIKYFDVSLEDVAAYLASQFTNADIENALNEKLKTYMKTM